LFFPNTETLMVDLDVPNRAIYLGGFNYMINSPDNIEPPITIYFTYAAGTVKMYVAIADD
jgi:hypothetical protein